RPRVFVAAACAAAVTAIAVGWWVRQPASSFRVAGEEIAARESSWIAPSDERPIPIDFQDGSRVMVNQGALARIASVEKDETQVEIKLGRAELDIVHHSGKRWQVGVGPFVVQV